MSDASPHPGSPATPFEGDRACRSYNRVFGAVCAVVLGGTALVNAVVDPYRHFHDGWAGLPYPKNERYLVPGLLKNSKYEFDAVTIGTSHSANFQPSVMEQVLGWKTLRCTLDGSIIPEQLLALRTALRTGRVRHVLWGIDYFAMLEPPENVVRNGRTPLFFYEPNWRTPFLYLLSGGTLQESWGLLRGHGETDLSLRGNWYRHQANKFGEALMLKATPKWVDYKRKQNLRPVPEIQDANLREIIRTIGEYPEVEFVCLLPPISVLSAVADFSGDDELFLERLRFRRDLFAAASKLPNACVYDFEQAYAVTHDFSKYKDPTHYDQSISDWMIGEIRAGRCRAWPEDVASFQREFDLRTRAYVRQVAQRDHPFYHDLALDRLNIDPEAAGAVHAANAARSAY